MDVRVFRLFPPQFPTLKPQTPRSATTMKMEMGEGEEAEEETNDSMFYSTNPRNTYNQGCERRHRHV